MFRRSAGPGRPTRPAADPRTCAGARRRGRPPRSPCNGSPGARDLGGRARLRSSTRDRIGLYRPAELVPGCTVGPPLHGCTVGRSPATGPIFGPSPPGSVGRYWGGLQRRRRGRTGRGRDVRGVGARRTRRRTPPQPRRHLAIPARARCRRRRPGGGGGGSRGRRSDVGPALLVVGRRGGEGCCRRDSRWRRPGGVGDQQRSAHAARVPFVGLRHLFRASGVRCKSPTESACPREFGPSS